MTTITYRDGVMAADSLVVNSDVVRGLMRKIVRTNNGRLVALCGDACMTIPFAAWIGRGEPQDDLPRIPQGTDFGALVAYPDGRVAAFSEKFLPQFVEAPFFSMGSGSEVALGAMAMGASAEEAVRVACRFDAWSREPVFALELERG